MTKYNVIYITIIFVFCSCKNNNSDNNKELAYQKELVPVSTLSFDLDSVSTFSPYTLQYLAESGEEYLLTDNRNMLSVDVYSFKEKKLIHRLMINDSTGELASDIHGFWAISKDSVFVYSPFRMNPIVLKLYNWEIVERSSMTIANPLTGNPIFNHASMTASPSFVMGNRIYFSELPLADISQLIGTDYSPEVVHDMGTDSTYTSGITWPEIYEHNKWDNLFLYLKTYDKYGRTIYSWEASHQLMVRKNDSIYEVSARSHYFDAEIIYDPNNVNSEGRDFNIIELDHYMMILYDSYRDVYYRFAIHGIPKNRVNGGFNTASDLPFSVIILDNNFNKLGETYFEPATYSPKDSFVGKEGLYISTHNKRSDQGMNEDLMSFLIFNLVDSQ